MNKINIFLSSDNNYAQHLGVTITSILINSEKDDNLRFYILDGGISEENKNKILWLKKIKNFEINFLLINPKDFEGFPIPEECTYISLSTYFRFKIASIVPDIDKTIYLDCDIVVKNSLQKIWEIDINNFLLGVVEDPAIPVIKNEARQRVGQKNYFNAGVMLINLKKWREINAEEQCYKFSNENREKILWVDQDILNSLFGEDVIYLHPRWNLQTGIFKGGIYEKYSSDEINSALSAPCIIHYSTHIKPWHSENVHKLEKEYFKYLAKTPWKNFIFKYKFMIIKNFLEKLVKSLSKGNLNAFKEVKYKSYEDLKEFFIKKNFQKRIDFLSKKYSDKKIIIYGTGTVFKVILDNFDLNKLNIAGISDIKYQNENPGSYLGFKTFAPSEIAKFQPDIVFLALLDTELAEKYFKDKIFPEYGKFKFEPLIKQGV